MFGVQIQLVSVETCAMPQLMHACFTSDIIIYSTSLVLLIQYLQMHFVHMAIIFYQLIFRLYYVLILFANYGCLVSC
jgi:hypothetical protein